MEQNKCDVEIFSRVTGFFRPVKFWNKGKRQEFCDRKSYDMSLREKEKEKITMNG